MKKRYLNYLLLLTIGLGLILLSKDGFSLFGSTTDWLNQHVSFANYFRDLFYETGSLFPDFSIHLGGGMNVFSISYYGLYSPWLLVTYLFPQIPMVYLVQIIEIGTYLLSICMLYGFFTHKKISNPNALFASILFACSGPLLFQFHRQFMFVNYMPFFILALYGVDFFFEKGKSFLLVLSLFLMIMTSYYYSVSGILVLLLYSMFYFFQEDDKKKRWRREGTFVFRIFIGVLLSSILIVPSFFALLSGRSPSHHSILSLFVPMISFWNVLYHNYTMGLPILAVLALVCSIWSRKKEIKIISISLLILFICPIFSAILNGGLYARGKVFIPFLPLVLYLVCIFLEHLEELKDRVPWKKVLVGLLLCMVIAYFSFVRGTCYELIFIIDVVVMTYSICRLQKNRTHYFYLTVLLVIPYAILMNQTEEYVRIPYQNQEIVESETLLTKVLEEDKNFYRVNNLNEVHDTLNQVTHSHMMQTSIYSSLENQDYKRFYYDVMKNAMPLDNHLMLANTINPLFQSYMGVKYLTGYSDMVGYSLKEEGVSTSLYENMLALPMFYYTKNRYSYDSFSKLKYPENIEALFMGAITEKGKEFSLDKQEEVDLGLQQLEGTFMVEEIETKSIPLTLSKEGILLLSFDVLENVSCREGENLTITIGGIRNTQSCKNWTYGNHNTTFYYTIPLTNDTKELVVTMEEGTYSINNIHTYFMEYDVITKYQGEVIPLNVQEKGTKDRIVSGNIEVLEDGYFVTSLPFDTGYLVYVDGVEIPYEKVNTAFLGFPLLKGAHTIEITYRAKGHHIGKAMSMVGCILFVGITMVEHKKKVIK